MAVGTGSFLDMLHEANAIVQHEEGFTGAELLEATLNLRFDGTPWRFVFAGPEPKGGTIFLKNVEGEFQLPPEFIDEPFLEDRAIPLPLTLDLADAQSLCDTEGCGGHPAFITLRWALSPGVKEPQYIFSMGDTGKRCFVGVDTKTVQCEPIDPPPRAGAAAGGGATAGGGEAA
jgi:hypothetical protein